MIRRIAQALALLVLLTSPVLAQRPFPTDLLPGRTATARVGLERQWYTAVPLSGANDHLLNFNVDQGLLIVQTSGGYVHAYDAETGRYFWGSSIGHSTASAFPAAVNSSEVFVTSLNEIYAFDRGTGRELFTVELEALPSTASGCDEEFVMVGLRTGKLVAYTARDKPKTDRYPGLSAGRFAFAWKTKGMLTARPLVSQKVIAFGSADHRVYVAIKNKNAVGTTNLLFRFLTGGPISANIAYYGNRTLIVPSGDNNAYGVDLFTGENRWSIATGSPIDQEPLVAGQDAYVINEEGRVLSIDPLSGEIRWSTETQADILLALSPTRLYLETVNRDLMILDRARGTLLASPRDVIERAGLNLRPFNLTFPNYFDDRLYFATASGLVVCLREIGQTQPITLRDPSLAPFGSVPKEGLLSGLERPVYLTPDGELKVGQPRGSAPAQEAPEDAGAVPAPEPEPQPEPGNANPFDAPPADANPFGAPPADNPFGDQ